MKKMFLLFSHKLNSLQKEDAEKTYDIKEFIYLPDCLQKIWTTIDPTLDDLEKVLEPIKLFLKKNSNSEDFVLIQGDFGACYSLVTYCDILNLIPVYATTRRVSVDKTEGEKTIKTSIFQHVKYRRYISKGFQ